MKKSSLFIAMIAIFTFITTVAMSTGTDSYEYKVIAHKTEVIKLDSVTVSHELVDLAIDRMADVPGATIVKIEAIRVKTNL